MINFFCRLKFGAATLGFTALLMANPLTSVQAEAVKYKKSTVVDFEGALVEGKSRKPYSAYLTQQKESAFNDLSQWSPDLDRSLFDSQRRMDKSL